MGWLCNGCFNTYKVCKLVGGIYDIVVIERLRKRLSASSVLDVSVNESVVCSKLNHDRRRPNGVRYWFCLDVRLHQWETNFVLDSRFVSVMIEDIESLQFSKCLTSCRTLELNSSFKV